MIKQRLTRRQFMQVSALGAGALALPAIGLASVAAAPSREAQAAAEQPLAPLVPQPTFNPIASNTTFGPLTDISMGWDGTLWGIDAGGAPHVYDSINDVWAQHGEGIDAAAIGFNTAQQELLYVFQGPNVVTIDVNTRQASAPTTIAALWPNLPDSFKLGVSGAVSYGFELILINGGRYVSTGGSVPLSKLTDLTNWPQTSIWEDGIIDSVIEVGPPTLLRAGQALIVEFGNKTVSQPFAYSDYASTWTAVPSAWKVSGVDAVELLGDNLYRFFMGTAVCVTDLHSTATVQYVGNAFGNWPSTWHPVLRHAPNGRDGNLWSVLPSAQGSYTMQHNGEVWTQLPFQADHVGVGQDNATMLASAQRLWTVVPNSNGQGYNVTSVSQANNLIQVSLGNANAVFARDTSNNVYSFDPASGNLTQNTDVSANGGALHIAVAADGSLWHAKPNDANMHRQLTNNGAPVQAIQVKQSLVTAVTKVAGTGFGASHCLVQDNQGNTQAYRYDSPYTFMSQNTYQVGGITGGQITQGLGNLYVMQTVSSVSPGVDNSTIIAIDAHTGVEVSRSAQSAPDSSLFYTDTVFDPVNELIYIGTWVAYPGDVTTPGKLLALDARDLSTVVWSFTTGASINARPQLFGNTLIFGDRAGTIYAINTQAAAANPASVTAETTWTLSQLSGLSGVPNVPGLPPGGFATFTPAIAFDDKYGLSLCLTYYYGGPAPFYVLYFYWVVLDKATRGAATYTAGGVYASTIPRNPLAPASLDFGPWLNQGAPPVRFSVVTNQTTGARTTYTFVTCDSALVQLSDDGPPQTFTLPTGSNITTGLSWDPNTSTVWFGDNNGNLYGITSAMQPAPHTPTQIGTFPSMAATPLPYTDTQGNTTVYVGVSEATSYGSLYGFDPVSGNIASVQTGVTQIMSMSADMPHGVIYVGGEISSQAQIQGNPQVFGVRADVLTQGQRDFIIESQLMQDPDQSAGNSTVTAPDGNIIPPSKSRYQTHLTLVDDQKIPLPKEAVKIWADDIGTVITVNGTQYTIGPDDGAYAKITTGVDGAVVITTEATDVNASALRVWAPFMNPYERIVTYPDHEWHGRVTQSNANGAVADPAKPNLNTAYKYDGATLFTQDEKNQGTTTNVANAVGQMNSGLNPGGSSPASVAGALKTLHASNAAAPYVAYTTLGGMHYGPNNARLTRTATIAAPFGFVLNKPKGANTPHTYTPLSHSDARSAIDALTGAAWDPNNPNDATPASEAKPLTFVVRRSDNIFTDFWNWLVSQIQKLVSDIENVIVSVADDIMVGINFIISGVEKAFKAIVKVIEDVVNAIGSFFLQLLKAIEDLIAALSILFHFGEIIWTHKWLRDQVNQRVTDLQKTIIDTTTTPPTKGPILTNIDSFFAQDEAAITGFFDSLKSQFSTGGNPQLNNTRGYGQSPHTAFTVGPKGSPPSSQAPQCTWGTDKAKTGMPSATAGSSRVAHSQSPMAATDGDPISDFFTGFIASLTTDPTLSAATSQLKNDFGNLFQSQSASQFFNQLMVALLDIIETLVIGAMTVANVLVDGLAGIIDTVVDVALNILNTEIQIPFLTWLYELLFQEKLTFLNIVTLVAAIPVTVVFRLVEGQYPSQAGLPTYPTAGASAGAMRINRGEVAPPQALIAFGVFVGVCYLVEGAANCISDGFGDDAPPALGYVSFVCGILIESFSFPLIGNEASDVSDADWAVYGLNVFGVITLAAGLPYTQTDGTPHEPASTEFMSFMSLVINMATFGCAIWAYIKDGKTDGVNNAEFAETIIETIVGMINPAKLTGEDGAAAVAVFDALGGIVEMFMSIFTALFANTLPAPRTRRLYFPFVPHSPRPVQAHPLALASAGARP